MIIIKSEGEINKIKKACDIWKKTRSVLRKNLRSGVSLLHLDAIARDTILNCGGKPAFKGYLGFPANICISRNRVIIHGIPDETCVQAGDKLTFDIGVELDGYFCDAAFTCLVPPVNPEMQKLNEITYNSLIAGIQALGVGKRIGVVGEAIKRYISRESDYYILPGFSGHGCGKRIHEGPPVFNDADSNSGPLIKEGMVLCIEPMVMTKSDEYVYTAPQWNVQAKRSDSLVCHWEHMVAVGYNKEVVVLTDETKQDYF